MKIYLSTNSAATHQLYILLIDKAYRQSSALGNALWNVLAGDAQYIYIRWWFPFTNIIDIITLAVCWKEL